MALTLGFTSMDKATEAALRAAFDEANATLGGRFVLAADDDAEFVIIDMDSMYGPMGWLRLHAAGKHVIGLTSAARTQADFRLGRPFDTAAMVDLLQQIAESAGQAPDAPDAVPDAAGSEGDAAAGPGSAPRPAGDPEPGQPPEAVPPPQSAPAAGGEPAPQPGSQSKADLPATADVPEASQPTEFQEGEPAATPPQAGLEAGQAADQESEPEATPREARFADWMQPGALGGRVRYRRGDGPELWLDADARQYHGPQQLKPLAPYFEGPVDAGDFQPVDEAAWSAGAGTAGEPQPMMRLQWLGGLMAGNGALLPGHDPGGRYRLAKWPQTEREYPHHFRIATAMMRGPATLPEIAEASRAPVADVADFVNANLATGYAEFVPEPEPEPEPAARPGGFFRRLRGRS